MRPSRVGHPAQPGCLPLGAASVADAMSGPPFRLTSGTAGRNVRMHYFLPAERGQPAVRASSAACGPSPSGSAASSQPPSGSTSPPDA